MSQPLFSIIVPVYDVEKYLRTCLESVLNQTCSDWECVCVDDGSPDGCGAILDDYAKRDVRFRVIHQSNGGVSAARNAALDVAKGEWVQFLDSDDSLADDFLVRLAEKIKLYPQVDAIEHAAVYCYSDGTRKIGSECGRKLPVGILTAQQILADPFGKKYTALARCSCYKIFRRSVIEAHRLRFCIGMPLSEDCLFATQFYAYAHEVVSCPEVAGYLRIYREGSALATIDLKKLLPCLMAMEELHRVWRDRPTPGLAVALSAFIVGAAFLGKEYGGETYEQCREAVLRHRFFNRIGIPFLIRYGTNKMRLFAAVYFFSSRPVRRYILGKL